MQRSFAVGSALLTRYACIARDAGATVLALVTSRAGGFYLARGFTIRGAAYYTAPVSDISATALSADRSA